jgi:glycosyltransferase involved in cell wall biosynthesis
MHIGFFDTDWRGHHTPYVELLSRYFIGQGYPVTFVTDEDHKHLDELPDSEHLSTITQSFPGDPQAPPNFLRSLQDQYNRTCQLKIIFQIAAQKRIDVLHLLYFDRTQIPLRLATLSKPLNFPVVATLHRDAFIPTRGDSLPSRAIGYATIQALDSILKRRILDVLTVHSDEIRDRIIDAVPSATTATVRTIPAPTPEPNIVSDTTTLRMELDLPQDRDIVLFFGGLRYEKGPDILAEQLRQLSRPLTAVFAGSPVDFSEMDVESWKRSLDPSVEIIDRLEYIPEAEVDRYFAAADATILPYRRSRGISGPLRRSAMVGTPVIGTTGTDAGALIERHGLGATFDPDLSDTFVRALESTLCAGTELRSALDTFASSRHWEQTGGALLKIYEEVL